MNKDQTLASLTIGNDVRQHSRDTAAKDLLRLKAGVPPGPVARIGSIEWRNKSVLLVDSNLGSRTSRARIMRTLGVRVDSVATADTARVRLAAEKYNLVLVDLGRDIDGAESLVCEVRTKNSHQLVGFLVGAPLFIATSLSGSSSRPQRTPAAAVFEKPGTPPCGCL